MQLIMSSLAKEGFGPGKNSVDEVLRHLWWKREHASTKLHLAEKTIKKMSGGDTKLALQVMKHSVEFIFHVVDHICRNGNRVFLS